jgi:Flp pilus assembly pilin Flp
MWRNKKGQNTLEYALIIAAVIAALLAINAYMKKGMQGRLKQSTDQIGKQFDASGDYTSAWKSESSGTTTTEEVRDTSSGSTTSTVAQGERVAKSETEEWGTAPEQRY